MVDTEKQAKVSPDMTPGQILRDVRESRGWTVKHISEFTRLSVQCIRDIEADDYTHIAAPVYLFGYFRSYSRALDISEEAIIQSFKALNHRFGQPNREEKLIVTPEAGQACVSVDAINKKRILRWGSLAVVFLTMFLVALWWHNQRVSSAAAIHSASVEPAAVVTQVHHVNTADVAKQTAKPLHDDQVVHHASIATKKTTEVPKQDTSANEILTPTYSVTPVSDNTGD